jgi:hypothetical protein
MFKSILITATIFFASHLHAQKKWPRAFPITDYIVALNDSTKVVQVELPEGLSIPDKEIGIIEGIYRTHDTDAVYKGYGRCNLIKGNYYYFSMSHNTSNMPLQAEDLVYVNLGPTNIYYGQIPKLAGHFIQLTDVYEKKLYDVYDIFKNWTEGNENALIDSMVNDIRFTGDYFLKNNPTMNIEIAKGINKGKHVLDMMMLASRKEVMQFLDYVIAYPKLYKGHVWKASEVYATWVSAGSPLAG